MAERFLTTENKAKVIEMLAARESFADIARAVGCSRQNIGYYASTYADEIKTASEEWTAQFINRGLRVREKRIERLEWLAHKHEEILYRPASTTTGPDGKQIDDLGGLFATEIKAGPNGPIEYQVYNAALVAQYRGILRDLAEETTGRITRVAPVSPDGDSPYDGGQAIREILNEISRIAEREEL